MTSELPKPGSIWVQTDGRQMRVIDSCANDISAHDAEMSDRYSKDTPIQTWRGNAEEFAKEFRPGNAEAYPKTAR